LNMNGYRMEIELSDTIYSLHITRMPVLSHFEYE
jgi:hypothetical protein